MFSELNDHEIDHIARISLLREWNKGSHVFFQDEPIENVYFIFEGKVKIYKTDMEGKEQIVSLLKKGGYVSTCRFFPKRRISSFFGNTREFHTCVVVTNDYNLNKVCELQKVSVLNMNDLANAVNPVVLPGEEMNVQLIKDGKAHNQGIAYLDDGTMIVVEDGREFIGKYIDVLVTSVLQTSAGRMIFAKPKLYMV